MTQHEMRRIALQALYLANQNKEFTADEVCSGVKNSLDLKTIPDYSKKLITGVLEDRDVIDEEISKYLKTGWSLKRLSQIDLAILELGLYEINNSDVIEPIAALNESLNLCDEFSSKKSKSFTNGLLANFIKEN